MFAGIVNGIHASAIRLRDKVKRNSRLRQQGYRHETARSVRICRIEPACGFSNRVESRGGLRDFLTQIIERFTGFLGGRSGKGFSQLSQRRKSSQACLPAKSHVLKASVPSRRPADQLGCRRKDALKVAAEGFGELHRRGVTKLPHVFSPTSDELVIVRETL